MADLLKIGHINYLNCWPITYPLMNLKLSFELVFGNPQELNNKYTSGSLRAGAMSSFNYLLNADNDDPFILLPNLSISSIGKVGSVLLISKNSFNFAPESIIELTSQSLTSVNLLKVLILEKYGHLPVLKTAIKPSLEVSDAILLIGDEALIAAQKIDTLKYAIIDLGQWWYDLFKLPMVFGLWGFRRTLYQENENICKIVTSQFNEALYLGLGALKEGVLETASKKIDYSKANLSNYFYKMLNFNFTPEHLNGLNLFKNLCHKHGLIKG